MAYAQLWLLDCKAESRVLSPDMKTKLKLSYKLFMHDPDLIRVQTCWKHFPKYWLGHVLILYNYTKYAGKLDCP